MDCKANVVSFESINFQLNNLVAIARRIHLFPFRTQKLSFSALMVLDGKLSGRVGRSQVILDFRLSEVFFLAFKALDPISFYKIGYKRRSCNIK